MSSLYPSLSVISEVGYRRPHRRRLRSSVLTVLDIDVNPRSRVFRRFTGSERFDLGVKVRNDHLQNRLFLSNLNVELVRELASFIFLLPSSLSHGDEEFCDRFDVSHLHLNPFQLFVLPNFFDTTSILDTR